MVMRFAGWGEGSVGELLKSRGFFTSELHSSPKKLPPSFVSFVPSCILRSVYDIPDSCPCPYRGASGVQVGFRGEHLIHLLAARTDIRPDEGHSAAGARVVARF